MSAPQFTRGPWTANKAWSGHPRYGIFKDRNIVVGKAWTEEDARLIAAAPELYETVRLFVEEYDAADQKSGVAMMLAYNSALEAGKAALAKARGGQ